VSLTAVTSLSTYGQSMEVERLEELEGQTSINELLDEPIGAHPIQLELPMPGWLHPVARQGETGRRARR
jgi:hypothetical protein